MHAALVAFAVLRLGMRLEVGPEYDSNANRAEVYQAPPPVAPGDSPPPAPIASFLVRGTAAGTLAWSTGPSTLRLGLNGGGKLFLADAATPQDVAVVQAALDESLRAASRLSLGLSGDYYDALQWNPCPQVVSGGVIAPDTTCHRDFRAGGARVQGTVVLGDWDLALAGGARLFVWKPDDDLSFESLFASASAGVHLRSGSRQEEGSDESEWDLSLSGRFEQRRYRGPQLVAGDDPGSALSPRRSDSDLIGAASLSYLGPLYGAVSYAIDFDRSSSFGQTFLRHLVTMKLAFELPGRIVATTKVQLVFVSYRDPVLLTSGMVVPLTIEDESRDALVVDLERPLAAGLSASVRYSVFRNGVSRSVLDYERHVVFVGLSWQGRR